MNPEQILLEAYISSTGNEISLEEFVSMINQDPSVLDNLYTWNDQSKKAIDQLIGQTQQQVETVEEETTPSFSDIAMQDIQAISSKYPILERFNQTKRPDTSQDTVLTENELLDESARLSDNELVAVEQETTRMKEEKLISEIDELQKQQQKAKELNPEINKIVENIYTDESEEIDPENPEQNIKAGIAGLTLEEVKEIEKGFDRENMFKPYEKQVTVSGIPTAPGVDVQSISGSRRITKTIQPYEEELKQAEKEIYNTILVLKEDEKRKRIEDRAYDIILEKAKNEKRTAKWEDYVEKEDTWMDYLRFYKSGKTAVTEHEKEIELIKKGVEDKKSIINKQAALQQLKTKAIANSVDRTLDKYSESVDEINLFSKNPNYNFLIRPGEETVESKDGRLIPTRIIEDVKIARENLIGLNSLYKQEDKKLSLLIDEAEDANTIFDITRRDYNDLKKFSVSLGLNALDLVASTGYGVYKLVNSPFEIAAEYTNDNLGVDPVSDIYLAFTNWKYDVMNDYQKDVVFDNAFDSFDNFGKWLSQTTAQQIPIIVSMIATGGVSGAAAKAAGLSGKSLMAVQNISSSAMIGFSSMGGKINELNYEEFQSGMKKYSAAEKLLKGTMYGVAEGTFAYFSTAPILNRGVNKLKGLGADDALDAIATGRFDFLRKSMRKDILPETAGEIFFEGLTTGTQNLIDGRPFFENQAETFVASGIFGLGMSGLPALYVAGTRDFSNNKQLKSIQESQKKQNQLYKKNAELIILAAEGKLDDNIDLKKEIESNLKLIDIYQSEIDEQTSIVEKNIKDKGMIKEAYEGYTATLTSMADVRNEVLEISQDPNKTDKEKEEQLSTLGKKYNQLAQARELFTDTKTFGSLYAALKGSSIFGSSERKRKFNEVTEKAKDNITKKKGESYEITQDDINTEAENILIDEQAEKQLKLDRKQSEKLGHNFQEFQTKQEATSYIYGMYEEAINLIDDQARKNKLIKNRDEIIDGINAGGINGTSIQSLDPRGSQLRNLLNLDFVVRDNMKSNRRAFTGIHENTHRITAELFSSNPKAFEVLGRQIISYLSFTGQNAALFKMNIDNPNVSADGKYDFDEVISSFMELVAEDRVDLSRMNNFTAVLGKTLNDGLSTASNGEYSIQFKGQEQILDYFVNFGKKFISGEIDLQDLKELKGKVSPEGKLIKLPVSEAVQTSIEQDALRASETDKNMFTAVKEVYDSDQSLTNKGLEIGNLYRNFVTSRLNKGFNVGKLFIKPRDFDGFNNEILEDVVSDMATGGSGIPGLVKAYANRNMSKFGDITLPQWINSRLNQRILGYLPNDLIRNDMSIDEKTARQIEDVKSRKFENVFDADIESGPREITPVEELSIVTPELVDEVKDIVTRTLKRTALTEGISNETVLADLNKAIEKEITKVIKSKMGPITKSVLGFAPKQYTDFIKNEMMTIVKSMPVNLIKQKAKSKAWAEVFKLKEIGREDIKKVNPDTGKITNYRKQIFEVQKPDPQKFQRYFTRGGYTTLIERQKSLIKPMAEQLARSELARLRQDKAFISDLADRTGLNNLEVTELFVDSVIKDIESDLDNTASEVLQQDTIKFSETLAAEGNKNPQIKQSFIDGLASDGFRGMLEANFVNGVRFPLRDAITQYFYEANIDLDKKQIKQIATEFSKIDGIQKQAEAALKKFDAAQVADLVALTMSSEIDFASDYKALELANGIEQVVYDYKDRDSVNQGRNLAVKIALAVGPALFNKHFRKGFSGPGGLGGLIVTGVPEGINITESEFKRTLPTSKIGGEANIEGDIETASNIIYKNSDAVGLETMFDLLTFRGYNVEKVNDNTLNISKKSKDIESDLNQINKYANKGTTARSSLFLGVADLEQNVLNNPAVVEKWGKQEKLTPMKKDEYTKDFYTKDKINGKLWDDLSVEEQLEYTNDLRDRGLQNQKVLRDTVEELAQMRRDNTLTPEEARWFVFIGAASMSSYIKSAAAFLGYPTLSKAQLIENLDLKVDDKFVLEHMTPAKRMALQIYRYLLDPSPANKAEFNKELDNFNTIMIPDGIDSGMLTQAGLRSSMGLNYKTGDPQFKTRYKELTKIIQFRLYDGTIVGENSSKFSKMNNDPKTKQANVELVDKSDVMKASETNNNGITIIETEVLDKALSIARDPNAPIKKIRVFDFDDTLAQSNSLVFYTMPDGTKGELTAEQFAEKGSDLLLEGAEFDFSDFNIVRDGKPGPLLEVAKKIQEVRGTEDVFVLTARAPESAQPIQSFLKSVGLDIPIENITGLGNSSAIAKSSWIVNKAAEGYNDFYFADDAPQNVAAVKRALDVVDVKSKVQQAKIKFSETVDQAMNDIIYQKTGIESFKEYSDVRAQAEGRGKRSFDLIPPSAEDFGGLLYRMLSKGKIGDAQWEWMQENLIRPYNRGVNDLVVMQNQLAADFKALKESLEGIPKNLKKKAFGGFTFEDVVRVHTWNKQGIEVDGISKRDLKDITDFVNANPELEVFSDQLIAITKADGYYYPGPNWLAGTITTDFREGLRTTSRARFLKQWQDNIDQAFSPKNLNKIEAAFGSKYREALEDSIQRMKTGTNRSAKIGRLEAQFLDYINGSVGAVMFLNARSAVLQTISSLNFINWGDNNVFAAGKAFANQPQYWKDFMTLMNSDYLVDRRNGLKINVSENEIAEAAKTSKNKAKAVISTLLSKGFVLTQFADSFAIASGGATFYRNRIKKLMKEGMSEAEATKKAFEDFKEISETSQQSADPSKISMQQASTIGKLILAWGNTPMQYNRIIKKATLDLVNGRGDWKDNISKIVYYGALQNIIFTTLQSGLFAVLFSDDEEESDVLQEKGLKTANSLIDNLLRGMGIGGAVISTIKNLGIEVYDRSKRKKPDYADVALKLLDVAPPIDVKVSKFRQGLTTYEYSQKDPRREEIFNLNNPSYMAAAKVIAATTNVPVDRLLQKAQNLEGAMNDQNEWWKRAAMFLGWPEWQLRSTKEAAEFKELQKERRKQYKESKQRQYAYREPLTEQEIKKQERAQDSISYFKLNKQEQVDKLDSLGLTKKEIRALRYEKDRVNKLLELME